MSLPVSSDLKPQAGQRPRASTSKAGGNRTVGEYEVTKHELGQGACAKVYKGFHKRTGEPVAVKVIQLRNSMNVDPLAEFKHLRRLNNPYVVRLLDSQCNNKYLVMILEFCAGGDLHEMIKRESGFSEDITKKFVLQLLDGLSCLHKQQVMHRDLKSANLLLTSNDPATANIKIADFGLAKSIAEGENDVFTTFCGTPVYMPPERLEKGVPYKNTADLWAVGVIMYEMLFAQIPFKANTYDGIRHKQLHEALPIPEGHPFSEPCLDILHQLLHKDVGSRFASVEDVLAHPWLKRAAVAAAATSPRDRFDVGTSPMKFASDFPPVLQQRPSMAPLIGGTAATPTTSVNQPPEPSPSSAGNLAQGRVGSGTLNRSIPNLGTLSPDMPMSQSVTASMVNVALAVAATERANRVLNIAGRERNPAHAISLYALAYHLASPHASAVGLGHHTPSPVTGSLCLTDSIGHRSINVTSPTASAYNIAKTATDGVNRCYMLLGSHDVPVVSATLLLFQAAVKLGRDAGVEEMLGNYYCGPMHVREMYKEGKELLDTALMDTTLSGEDRKRMQNLSNMFQRRITRNESAEDSTLSQ